MGILQYTERHKIVKWKKNLKNIIIYTNIYNKIVHLCVCLCCALSFLWICPLYLILFNWLVKLTDSDYKRVIFNVFNVSKMRRNKLFTHEIEILWFIFSVPTIFWLQLQFYCFIKLISAVYCFIVQLAVFKFLKLSSYNYCFHFPMSPGFKLLIICLNLWHSH